MKTRIKQAALILASSASLASPLCQAKEDSKPIVDVRFDAPYRQVEPSSGDEWAPTWGRNDVLYTGVDDGNAFGGIAANNFVFGKLEGDDPYKLKGISVNGMEDFREPHQPGPVGAMWKTLDSYETDGVRYRLAPCGADASPATCLMISSDRGKSWTRGKTLFQGMNFVTPSFISVREIRETLLGGKPGEYIYAASYADVIDGRDHYALARVPKAKLSRGDTADWSFRVSDGVWRSTPDKPKLEPNDWPIGTDGANWKTMNSYSVDGVLYMFVTRCHYPFLSDDPQRRHIFQNSSIIKSTDEGRTWTRPAADNFKQPMFPGKRFGAPYFVWYGKDGAARADNADQYVYAVSNNGHFENGDDYVIGRVPRSKLPNLSAADWSFYTTGDGMQEGSWTAKLGEAKPILRNPGRSSMTGMTYIEGLRRYVMVSWHYNQANFEAGIKAKDLSTVLELFEAPKPWGPWTRVKTYQTGQLGWYVPIVGQRFQSAVSSTTVTGFLYPTGFYTKPEGGLDMTLYKFNYIPITLSTKPLKHKDPAFVGGR